MDVVNMSCRCDPVISIRDLGIRKINVSHMEESQYIYETLLLNQASPAIEYFNSRAPSCFASEENQVQLSIYRENSAVARCNGADGLLLESEPLKAASEQCLPDDSKSTPLVDLLSIHSTKELVDFSEVKIEFVFQKASY
jgi:hypothetical protein